MPSKFFSVASFIGGLLLGIVIGGPLVVGGIAWFVVHSNPAAQSNNSIVGMIGNQLRQSLGFFSQEATMTSIYGRLKNIDAETIEIEADRLGGVETLKFQYDSETQFVEIANDDAATEIVVDPSTLVVGESITVLTAEAVGSVPNQYVLKVVKF